MDVSGENYTWKLQISDFYMLKVMKSPQIWYFQMYCSLLTSNYHFSPLTSNYHFLMQVWNLIFSNVLFSTDLQLSLLQAKVWNLKISSVMCSIDLQLSLLHAKVWNLKFSVVMFSTNFQLSQCKVSDIFKSMKSQIFMCNVLYWPPIITFTC